MRPYEEVVEEVSRLWAEGVNLLKRASALTREQGFVHDTADLAIAIQHVEGHAIRFLSAQDPYARLREIEIRLWLDARHDADFVRRDREVWILCPRAHAEQHGFRIHARRRIHPDSGRELFRMAGRFHDGEDLVYAIAPGQ